MANTLRTAGFTSCKADADVWLRPAVKADGTKAGQSYQSFFWSCSACLRRQIGRLSIINLYKKEISVCLAFLLKH